MNINKLCVNCFNEKNAMSCTNCGYIQGNQSQNELHLPPGSVLKGQHLIGRVLRYGGFGVTYLAYDLNLETLMAIKEYLPGDLSARAQDGYTVYAYSGEAGENYEYGLNRFLEEGRVLSKYLEMSVWSCFIISMRIIKIGMEKYLLERLKVVKQSLLERILEMVHII